MSINAITHRKSTASFQIRKKMEFSNIEALLWRNFHDCQFQCHSKIPIISDQLSQLQNRDLYYSSGRDLDCEDSCKSSHNKFLDTIDKKGIHESIQENEVCLSHCIMPKKGITD